MLAGNREFVRRNPVATKRVLRAILKAADLCVSRAGAGGAAMVDGGFTTTTTMRSRPEEIPYDKWREYDPEDTIRFYALRLHEAGMIKSTRRRSSPRARTGAS